MYKRKRIDNDDGEEGKTVKKRLNFTDDEDSDEETDYTIGLVKVKIEKMSSKKPSPQAKVDDQQSGKELAPPASADSPPTTSKNTFATANSVRMEDCRFVRLPPGTPAAKNALERYCPECKHVYARKNYAQEHIRKKHPELLNKIGCKRCPMAYTDHKALEDHYWAVHKLDIPIPPNVYIHRES